MIQVSLEAEIMLNKDKLLIRLVRHCKQLLQRFSQNCNRNNSGKDLPTQGMCLKRNSVPKIHAFSSQPKN